MRFIREIIGEKRQMEASAMREPLISPSDSTPREEAKDSISSAKFDEKEVNLTSENDAHDELAEFFSRATEYDKSAEHDENLSSQREDAPVPQPRTMVVGKAFGAAHEADKTITQDAETPFENEARATSQSMHPNDPYNADSFKNVFRDLNDDPETDAGEVPLDSFKSAEPDIQTPKIVEPEPTAPEPQKHAQTPPPVHAQTSTAETSQVEVPQPALGRGSSRHGRVKTRLLGFNTSMEADIDPIKGSEKARAATYTSFPVGWLIVIEGEGRGSTFSLFNGVSNIGRGSDQTICLDFGDNSISREAHASIAYDERQQSFYIGHCGRTNIVRRNDRPVLSTDELNAGDHITIGETTLRFVPLCGPEFSWEKSQDKGRAHAVDG